MNSNDKVRSERMELLIAGQALISVGIPSLAVAVAIVMASVDSIAAMQRTLIGLVTAVTMIGVGQLLSRRNDNKFYYWTNVHLMGAGYALAYFFTYALYYMEGLKQLDTPYLPWVLGTALAGLATLHGSRNRAMRFITPVFTLLVTGHVSFHVLTSAAVVTVFGATIKVAALGCFAGMLWCAGLSAVYKRLEGRYTWPGTTTAEATDWLFNRIAHEVYFIAAALNAMALPLFLTDLTQAPLWWAVEAPLLLALSWRGANYFKHGVIGLIWAAAVGTLLNNAFHANATLPVLVTVPLAGIAMGLAYRLLKSNMVQGLKVGGYCLYTYAAVAVALLVPYVQCGNVWDAMPYWMIQGLVICGAGLALRDRIVHDAGWIASLGALVLFALQYNTWSWALVGPVVACSYALSVAYGYVRRQGGWSQTDFLPKEVFGWEHTVTAARASGLENLWSWVGTGVLVAASLLLRPSTEAVLWWSAEALLLVVLSSITKSERYRHQGLLAFALAGGKLIFWDVCRPSLGWSEDTIFTLYRGLEFAVYGACCYLASILLFRREAQLEALESKAQGNGASGDKPEGNGQDGNQ